MLHRLRSTSQELTFRRHSLASPCERVVLGVIQSPHSTGVDGPRCPMACTIERKRVDDDTSNEHSPSSATRSAQSSRDRGHRASRLAAARRRDRRGCRGRGADAARRAPVVTRAGARPRARRRARRRRRRSSSRRPRTPCTTGTVIGPTRDAYTLPAEASGRTAVQLLTRPARRVHAARAPRTRSPCGTASPTPPTAAASPRPSRSPSTASTSDTMTLTSEYAWLYNQYPFTNDPNAGLLHPDWWITECGCVPGEGYEVQHAVPPDALLRRAADAPRQDLSRRRRGAAHGTARHECSAGR